MSLCSFLIINCVCLKSDRGFQQNSGEAQRRGGVSWAVIAEGVVAEVDIALCTDAALSLNTCLAAWGAGQEDKGPMRIIKGLLCLCSSFLINTVADDSSARFKYPSTSQFVIRRSFQTVMPSSTVCPSRRQVRLEQWDAA